MSTCDGCAAIHEREESLASHVAAWAQGLRAALDGQGDRAVRLTLGEMLLWLTQADGQRRTP